MSITFNKPINEWYYEDTSVWTLDYPIFFAYFEWVLGFFASIFDPNILVLSKEPFFTKKTLIFQRLSVIISELISLVPSVILICRSCPSYRNNSTYLSLFFTSLNASLIIVDNIHFQYNGFLMGILLLSIYLTNDYPLLSASLFTCLVFTKHYFVVLAPVWFTFLLSYCVKSSEVRLPSFIVCSLKPLLAVLSISAFAMFPIFVTGQTGQFISRLFPISRSFIHFIPASNIYTIYALGDKLLAKLHLSLCRVHYLDPDGHYIKSMKCIPPIKPIFCMVACIIVLFPVLARQWLELKKIKKPMRTVLMTSSISLLIAFQFGYHIHEKQILYALLPLGIYTVLFCENDQQFIVHYIYLNNWSNLSMMVLLETYPENIIKYVIVAVYHVTQLIIFKIDRNKYGSHNILFILGIIMVFFIEFFMQKVVFDKLQLVFVYHALSSIICTLPICYYTYYFYYRWIFGTPKSP
ncbi:hypothetical protein OJ252_1619 [Cryptosporidium canis]|uniref:Alpha-1,3-glucosyltransferase n=1 Tax=Cryptosporidium canis TaxID=195482 RepID=A0ABQ8PAL8_9CRYT|nr:hypothetical protein OJ252_1619 [Cryptosporidium canis]